MAICMVALPPVSYDYTLVHLYIPFALIVLAAVHACAMQALTCPASSGRWPVLRVIFTPQLFFFHNDLALNGVLKSLAMIGLLVLLARYPFPDPEWQTPSRAPASNPPEASDSSQEPLRRAQSL